MASFTLATQKTVWQKSVPGMSPRNHSQPPSNKSQPTNRRATLMLKNFSLPPGLVPGIG